MKKYRVTILPPKAKRMIGSGKITLYFSDGWCPGPKKEYPVDESAGYFEFEVGDDYDYVYNTTCNDGPTFDCKLEYSNQNGSRKEAYRLVPYEIR